MLKIFLAFLFYVIISKQWMFVKGNADECALNTECIDVRKCPHIWDNFLTMTRKPYCNLNKTGTFVCCYVAPPPYIPAKDETRRSVQECKSYMPERENCDKPLIVGGKKSDPKEFPFMALLFYQNNSDFKQLCGGTLLSSRFVMSAAHCFFVETDPPNIVRLGELDYNTTVDDAKPVDIPMKDIKIHPNYDYDTKFNDIALIELEREVKFNEYILPACLPLSDGREFIEFLAAGWGAIKDVGSSSTHLLNVKLDSFNDTTCLQRIGKKGPTINTTIQLCAGSFSEERDTCTGDSGGPLFVDHPDAKCMFLVLGVTSYSEGGCANINYPAFYTRVSSYTDWIEQIVWR